WAERVSTGFQPENGVQYRPDRIMVAGGKGSDGFVTGMTKTFDASNISNSWQTSGSMVPRMNANLVLLPTGQGLALGGNQENVSSLPVRRPQIWYPDSNGTGVWSDVNISTALAEQPTIRGYHSTAILLPDGRVLSAGGSDNHDVLTSDQHLANLFCPPYLFKSVGGLAARPVISAKPESLGFGKIFTICVPDTAHIYRASLIRPAATTHAADMNQRYVPLNFTKAGQPARLLATSPASPD